MKEKNLLYISIISSLAGLALLYFVSQNVELVQAKISTITPDDIGKNVKVCGEIVSKSVSKTKHIFLKLKDESGEIDLVVFNNTAGKLNTYDLDKNDRICAVGSVNEFQNELEIIPKEITRVE